MFPSFELFGRIIYMYSIVAAVGAVLAGVFVCRQVKTRGQDDNEAIVFLLVAGVGVVIGSHILYGITNWDKLHLLFEVESFAQFKDAVSAVLGGAVFYGGLLGGIAAGLIYLRKKRMDVRLYTDVCAPAVALLHGIARVGCFLGGCCYGVESEFGFIYHDCAIEAANGVRRFPVQLLESALELGLFFLLWRLLSGGRLKGRLFYLYLTLYSVLRFADEFLRGDELRGFVLGLSTSQFISIFVFVAGALGLWLTRKGRASNEHADL